MKSKRRAHQAKQQFETIQQTRKYFSIQRTILFGFFITNMLRPYLSAVVPLFVLAGSQSAGLETYFYALIFIIGLIMWMLMKFVSHSYPKECGQSIVNYFDEKTNKANRELLDVNSNSITKQPTSTTRSVSTASTSIQSLQNAGKHISAPSLLKCIMFLEGWREAELVKRVTTIILLGYGVFLLYLYITLKYGHEASVPDTSVDQTQPQTQKAPSVSPQTLVVLYITFLTTVYSIYMYDGPFFEEMVSNPTASATYVDDCRAEMEQKETTLNEQKKKRSSNTLQKGDKESDKKDLTTTASEYERPSTKSSLFKQSSQSLASLTKKPQQDIDAINQQILEHYEKQKEGFFHDIGILRRLFTTTFPDECFPLHLTIADIFTDSSDLLAQLKTCASIVDHFHREDSVRESMLIGLDDEDDDDENRDVEGQRIPRTGSGSPSNMVRKRSKSVGKGGNNNKRDTKNNNEKKFSGPSIVTIEQLSRDPRFRDINWGIFSDGVMPPHVQINFLRMLHVFFMEGLGEHVGEFLEENEVVGRRLANMATTVDDNYILSEIYFLCSCCSSFWSYLCCWCCLWKTNRDKEKRQQELFRSQSVTSDNSISISYDNPLANAKKVNVTNGKTIITKK